MQQAPSPDGLTHTFNKQEQLLAVLFLLLAHSEMGWCWRTVFQCRKLCVPCRHACDTSSTLPSHTKPKLGICADSLRFMKLKQGPNKLFLAFSRLANSHQYEHRKEIVVLVKGTTTLENNRGEAQRVDYCQHQRILRSLDLTETILKALHDVIVYNIQHEPLLVAWERRLSTEYVLISTRETL